MADELSGWTLQQAEPTETTGWTLHPVAQTAPAPPSVGSAIAHGAGQGATLGFGDEINGAVQALGDLALNPAAHLRDLPALYRHNRDAFRREDDAAREAHPRAFGATEAAAGIPASFLPGLRVANGASKAATLLRMGVQGGLAGLGTSKADTALGDAANAAGGAGLGAGLGWAGNKLGQFASKAADEVRLALADGAQATATKAQKALDAARGALGGDTASVLDAAKSYEHALTSPLASLEQKAQAKAVLAAQEFQALYQNALKNKLELTSEKMGGRLLNSRAAYETAKAAATPAAIDEAATASMANPLRKQVLPRLLTYAERGVPLLVGHHFGGIPGMAAGLGMAAVMGKPGTALANMVKNPGVREAMWSGLGGVASHALQPAVQHSGAAAELALAPDIAARIAALRKAEPDPSQWMPEGSP